MAGGTFVTQNKVRPGAYINFKTQGKSLAQVSDRGIVTIPLVLDWGPVHEIVEVEASTDVREVFGQSSILHITEALKRSAKVLVYRLAGGTKATKLAGALTVTAKYDGTRGNKLIVTIIEDIDNAGSFIVKTYLDGELVKEQTSDTIDNLENNNFVEFSGTGALVANAGIVLAGGTDTAVVTQDYLDYLTAVEVLEWNAMGVPTTDNTIKSTITSFIKRMRDTEGKMVQGVLADYSTADSEGIISVKNGVVLVDGTIINNVDATAWVAGATAGANVNESNTYAAYDGTIDVDTKYTNSQIIAALESGELVFVDDGGKAVIEQDINTLTTFTPDKGKMFAKNKVVRVIDGVGNGVKKLFSDYYLGKVPNNADGRNLFKAELIKFFETLQGIGAIQNFESKDIVVSEGTDSDSIVVDIDIQPVDAIEKIYMSITLL